ncbi:MAG: tRNA preQ1(34) S-adenosylmethionine ribosyltransferase-isomerase QueA [Pseudomonadaceae bacterium]|nr:tRNA preQ1(34) S-adenosylmethionine ribosyltransferase-isomerase QueA [Pseudomonadaceae bacterium]
MTYQLSDFDYALPSELIAQHPKANRTDARLLQLLPEGVKHGYFPDIQQLLQPGDLLVINNTRVIKARLFAQKDSGGQAEVLFERLLDPHRALCQVRVSKPLKTGRHLNVASHPLTCESRQGQFYVLVSKLPWLDLLDQQGHVPLPPYIERDRSEQEPSALDEDHYQTVYGQIPGAVAAPTAGLHFSEALLATLRTQGVDIAEVTLHVGSGTFQPVRGELADHVMHSEYYQVEPVTAQQIQNTQDNGGRVVAVGTTVVRTLESSAAANGGRVTAGEGDTQLFITPGFRFQVVDALITNFHLPASTLMMLVTAFAGYDEVMHAYREAVEQRYQFFSYGDAMFLHRQDSSDV